MTTRTLEDVLNDLRWTVTQLEKHADANGPCTHTWNNLKLHRLRNASEANAMLAQAMSEVAIDTAKLAQDWSPDRASLRPALTQLAACAIRAIRDLCDNRQPGQM